ncbi:hypothetical protein A8B82_04410 [Sulfitobacter sp. EhC04]|uniref:hypothetical protein n=1 Tax=Sulfitobacter sp. EhC04 TaxID=1849168 RepID=UPI0007F440E0|nr:hypothetical protein [Sulfitobacter sp. EhC04]OAN71530.1 hypothetical protein A8B82_04410 [Sulfitobacter sp. EhC04]
MPDLWFVEERNPFGQWSPATYHGEKPTEKQIGGRRREFRRDPREVNVGHHYLSLSDLAENYSPDGRFYLAEGADA